MIPAAIANRIREDLLRIALSARITGETREKKMGQLLETLNRAGYIRAVSTHSLTSMYVEALMKLRQAQRMLGKREWRGVHIRKEMYQAKGSPYQLSTDQWTNFGKLRYWGLAVHADKKHPRSGYWVVTTRGNEFLEGLKPVPKHMYTIGPHRLYPGEDEVWVRDYLGELPRVETYNDFNPPAVEPKETSMLPMFAR